MKDQITPDRIANSIRLLRGDHEGVFLIVEGHSDKLIYERLVNKQEVRVTIASGKNNAIKALSILEKEDNFRRVVAVIDADFSRIEQQIPDSNNLFLTDEHDLEMMLIKSAAFDKLLKERGSEEKIKAFTEDIRETLLKLGQEIGKLRWLSLRNKLDLKFEGLNTDFLKEDSKQFSTMLDVDFLDQNFLDNVLDQLNKEFAKQIQSEFDKQKSTTTVTSGRDSNTGITLLYDKPSWIFTRDDGQGNNVYLKLDQENNYKINLQQNDFQVFDYTLGGSGNVIYIKQSSR